MAFAKKLVSFYWSLQLLRGQPTNNIYFAVIYDLIGLCMLSSDGRHG